ncbi:MAG: RNA polymerase sigma factor [Saprospiraceae bacterium]
MHKNFYLTKKNLQVQVNKVQREEFGKLSDAEIIQIILDQGKKELLEILYDRYAAKIYYKCLGITGNTEISKDLTHDILIKIFINLSKFRGASDFSLWIHSITYNYCMDYLRKKKKMQVEKFEVKDFDYPSMDEIELENKILADLKLSQLEILLQELKPEEKIILLMRYQDSMSVKQIAQTLIISESAVKMRLKRSRDRLAELLKDPRNERQ